METVRIITLHLDYGGIEKAVCQMASMFAEKYDVEIISVYDMPDAPALLQQLQREKRKLEAVRSEVHQSQPRLVRLWECLQASRSMK